MNEEVGMKNEETKPAFGRRVVSSFLILHSYFAAWEPNPILLKELRQAVRSNVLTGVLMLFLVMLFLGSMASMAGQTMIRGEVVELGRNMFDACLTVLAVSSLVVIPLYTGIRVALEQHQSDMILFTPLPVTKLVQGKVLGGICLAGLFYSVCLPFMTFTSLLRGLDWLTIQFVLIMLFIAICVAVLASVAVAVLPFRVLFKLIWGVVFAGSLAVICKWLLFFFFDVVRSGAAPLLESGAFWSGFIGVFGVSMVGAMAAYSVSISHIIKDSRPGNIHGYNSQLARFNG